MYAHVHKINVRYSVYNGMTVAVHPTSMQKPQLFHHDVQWDIADIRMLLGSDLPIFGRDSHPAISLRLRYMYMYGEVCTQCAHVHNCVHANKGGAILLDSYHM